MAATNVSRETDPFSVRALTRGLSILGLFDVDHREWTIDEMAEQTGLRPHDRLPHGAHPRVHGLPGPRSQHQPLPSRSGHARHVLRGRRPLGLRRRGPAVPRGARQETGESVTLAVEVDGFPVCVDIINTTRPFKRQTAPGRILGDIVTVHGKIFAAFKPPEERETPSWPSRVPSTLPTPSPTSTSSRPSWSRSRAEDVAYDMEGSYLGTCAVGAPVRDQFGRHSRHHLGGHPRRALRAGGRELCTEAVKAAAASFSAYLGWTPS